MQLSIVIFIKYIILMYVGFFHIEIELFDSLINIADWTIPYA